MSDAQLLMDKTDFLLNVGAKLLANGAHATRVHNIVTKLAKIVGFQNPSIIIHFSNLTISYSFGDRFYSKAIKIEPHRVNMNIISEISIFTWNLDCDREIDFAVLRDSYDRMMASIRSYPHWLVSTSVAVSCSAFCRLLGGSYFDLLVSFFATLCAFYTKKILEYFFNLNRYAVIVITTFAGTIAAASFSDPTDQHYPVISNILFLMPGVPFVNTFIDVMSERPVMGASRLIVSISIMVCIVMGITLGLTLFGVHL